MKAINPSFRSPESFFVLCIILFFCANVFGIPQFKTADNFLNPEDDNAESIKLYKKILESRNDQIDQFFVVSDPGDESDEDLSDGIYFPKTFRSALENANLTPELDHIIFTSTMTIIYPSNAYADLLATERISIDGSVGPLGFDNIILDGSNDWNRGLWLTGGHSTLMQMVIRNFPEGGLVLQGDSNIVSVCEIYENGGPGINFGATTNSWIGGPSWVTKNIIYGNTGPTSNGIVIISNSNNNIIEGNWIGTKDGISGYGNERKGIYISGSSNNTIKNNVISDNEGGIYITGNSSEGNVIESNYIGTDSTGTIALSNGGTSGIYLFEGSETEIAFNLISGNTNGISIMEGSEKVTIFRNRIGTDITTNYSLPNNLGILNHSDSIVIEGNVISGNSGNGLQLYAGSGGHIKNNMIGTDIAGIMENGNVGYGIRVIYATGIVIGGDSIIHENIISANGEAGIWLSFNGATGTTINNNMIGASIGGNPTKGNLTDGILISNESSNNIIVKNTIAGNFGNGVNIESGQANLIEQNQIFKNDSLGIDLQADGVTPNDPDDSDTGPNNLQNFPVVDKAITSAEQTTIEGRLFSTPNTFFILNFFYNDSCDVKGYGEGQYYIGEALVTTDNEGEIDFSETFDIEVPDGKYITSTATDENYNTSEFSLCFAVGEFGMDEHPDKENTNLTLHSVHPNPLSNYTIFNYSLREDTYLLLDIYDINGNHIQNLIPNKPTKAGDHNFQWEPTLNVGTYLFRFYSNGRQLSGKINIIDAH